MCSSQRMYRSKKLNLSVVVVRKDMSKLSLSGFVGVKWWERKVTVYVFLRRYSIDSSPYKVVNIALLYFFIKLHINVAATIQNLSFFQLFLLVLLFHNTMLFNLSCLLILGHQDTDLEIDIKITDGSDMPFCSLFISFLVH
jgi:hypothetical protein